MKKIFFYMCLSVMQCVITCHAMEEEDDWSNDPLYRCFISLRDSYRTERNERKNKSRNSSVATECRKVLLDKLKALSKDNLSMLQEYLLTKDCPFDLDDFKDLYSALKCYKDILSAKKYQCFFGEYRKPILHEAINAERVDIVMLLLAVGAFMGYDENANASAIAVAFEVENFDIIKLIVYAGGCKEADDWPIRALRDKLKSSVFTENLDRIVTFFDYKNRVKLLEAKEILEQQREKAILHFGSSQKIVCLRRSS